MNPQLMKLLTNWHIACRQVKFEENNYPEPVEDLDQKQWVTYQKQRLAHLRDFKRVRDEYRRQLDIELNKIIPLDKL